MERRGEERRSPLAGCPQCCRPVRSSRGDRGVYVVAVRQPGPCMLYGKDSPAVLYGTDLAACTYRRHFQTLHDEQIIDHRVSCLPYGACLLSPVSCLLCPVSCALSPVSGLPISPAPRHIWTLRPIAYSRPGIALSVRREGLRSFLTDYYSTAVRCPGDCLRWVSETRI